MHIYSKVLFLALLTLNTSMYAADHIIEEEIHSVAAMMLKYEEQKLKSIFENFSRYYYDSSNLTYDQQAYSRAVILLAFMSYPEFLSNLLQSYTCDPNFKKRVLMQKDTYTWTREAAKEFKIFFSSCEERYDSCFSRYRRFISERREKFAQERGFSLDSLKRETQEIDQLFAMKNDERDFEFYSLDVEDYPLDEPLDGLEAHSKTLKEIQNQEPLWYFPPLSAEKFIPPGVPGFEEFSFGNVEYPN